MVTCEGKGGATVAALDLETELSKASCGFGKTPRWRPSSKRSGLDTTLAASHSRFRTSKRKRLGRSGGSPSKRSGARHATDGCMETKFIRGRAGLRCGRGGVSGLMALRNQKSTSGLPYLHQREGRIPRRPPLLRWRRAAAPGGGKDWRQHGASDPESSFSLSFLRRQESRAGDGAVRHGHTWKMRIDGNLRGARTRMEASNQRRLPRVTDSREKCELAATCAIHGLT